MSQPLPRLRLNLEFSRSPAPDRPGLLIRDPFHYSEAVIIVPPALTECLTLFDGQATELDLREMLVRLTGDLRVGEIGRHLIDTLSKSGFLEDDVFYRLRDQRQMEFAAAPARDALLAGSAYPADAQGLRELLGQYMNHAGRRAPLSGLCGIASPHVSPHGGWQSYQAAYGAMPPDLKDRTFVILGTSHYGEPERFGLTRKPFLTPFGQTSTDRPLVDWLAANGGPAVTMEDYCHAIEHSIEFQVLFLQHLYGPSIRILPVLCGAYLKPHERGGMPDQDEDVRRFLDALREMACREQERLFWVLGIDMAHMGRRYGDPFPARAEQGVMLEVAARDQARIGRIVEGDAEGFWSLVRENRDDLKWCGASPLYTFLKAVPEARGELLRYEQWNIDEESVVTFGGLRFRK